MRMNNKKQNTVSVGVAVKSFDRNVLKIGAMRADFYNPFVMPPNFVKAHAHFDALVDEAYGLKSTATDSDRVSLLFKLYAEKK